MQNAMSLGSAGPDCKVSVDWKEALWAPVLAEPVASNIFSGRMTGESLTQCSRPYGSK